MTLTRTGGVKCFILVLLVNCLIMQINAQKVSGYKTLQAIAKSNIPKYYCDDLNSAGLPTDSAGNYDYISPIISLIQNKEALLKKYDSVVYFTRLTALLSFIGDYKSSLLLLNQTNIQNPFVATSTIPERLKKIIPQLKLETFSSFLVKNADNNLVIMMNEAHYRSQHRMNVICILDFLYKKGFRTLAVEALNNFESLQLNPLIPGSSLGYYTSEPTMSEMLRYASKIGYALVPYEVQYSKGQSGNRDSIQAINIINSIKINPENKLLVYAGYGHIEERSLSPIHFMGCFFKDISKIDPLTIDQTKFSDGPLKSMDQAFYYELIKGKKIETLMIPLYNGNPYTLYGNQLTDVSLIQPRTEYINDRPNWLRYSNLKKEYRAFIPKAIKKQAFLIQAYYKGEADKKSISKLVPADQTYDKSKKYYSLYLFPGVYFLIIRDIDNSIILQKEIVVVE